MTRSTPGNPPRSRNSHWRAGCSETGTSGSAGGRAEKDPLTRVPRRAADPAHLGVDNIKTVYNTVSTSSSRLVAYNTLHTAFADNYKIDLDSQEDLDREVDWLVDAWHELAQALPAVGKIGKSRAQAIRGRCWLAAPWRSTGTLR